MTLYPFDDYSYAIRRTLDSGGLLPICYVLGIYDFYEDAEDDLEEMLADGADGTFEIVQVRLPRGW